MEGGDSLHSSQEKSSESEICTCACGDPCTCLPIHGSIASTSTDYEDTYKLRPRKADYGKAKAFLSQPSAYTCDNVLDHLKRIINRVIDERPTNVIDYFENFSRTVRCGLFRESEWLAHEQYREPQFLSTAGSILNVLQLPYKTGDKGGPRKIRRDQIESCDGDSLLSKMTDDLIPKIRIGASQSENVLHILHLWAFCGLGFHIDEMFQLSQAISKIQTRVGIESARFWGRMYGTCRSYYIVEATLTKCEIENRMQSFQIDVIDKMIEIINRNKKARKPPKEHPCLIPGYFWQFLSEEAKNLERMKPEAVSTPYFVLQEDYEAPPEPIGCGLNRRTYFVVTALKDEWTELPIVTPNQIKASRKIRKYFTGFLEEPLVTYPPFPGCEKHYLRAVIARITAGTYIAPTGYYRKMTRFERKLLDGEFPGEMEGEEEGEEEIQEDICGNDCPTIENQLYEPAGIRNLRDPCFWDHVRPYILNQGRIDHVDEELALKDLEKRAFRRIKILESQSHGEEGWIDEEEGEEEDTTLEQVEMYDEGEEEMSLQEDIRPEPEVGPDLFTPCGDDQNTECVPPWTSRVTTLYSLNNRMVLMRSNLWPGAFSFTFEKYADSLYFGWGLKYVARSMTLVTLPPINECEYPFDLLEATDPTPEMEERWRLWLLRSQFPPAEELSLVSVEFDVDDEEDRPH